MGTCRQARGQGCPGDAMRGCRPVHLPLVVAAPAVAHRAGPAIPRRMIRRPARRCRRVMRRTPPWPVRPENRRRNQACAALDDVADTFTGYVAAGRSMRSTCIDRSVGARPLASNPCAPVRQAPGHASMAGGQRGRGPRVVVRAPGRWWPHGRRACRRRPRAHPGGWSRRCASQVQASAGPGRPSHHRGDAAAAVSASLSAVRGPPGNPRTTASSA